MVNMVLHLMKQEHFNILMNQWVGEKKIMFMVMLILKFCSSIKLKTCFFFLVDISKNNFPANYFEQHAIYYKNHDMNNNPICNLLQLFI